MVDRDTFSVVKSIYMDYNPNSWFCICRRCLISLNIGISSVLIILLFAGHISATAPAYPIADGSSDITDALTYLRASQEADGSIGGFVTSAWVTMAIAAAGEDPHGWMTTPASPSVVDYLRDNYSQIETSKATDWERSILAIVAACEDPYDFGGIDYVAGLKGLYDGNQNVQVSQFEPALYSLIPRHGQPHSK